VRKFLVGFTVVLLALVLHDLTVSPEHALGAKTAIFFIDEYREHISPRLKGVVTCRFKPTCSAYGREAIRKRGLLIGGTKTIVRIAKCGPWTKAGTVDMP
jgi:putative membrane protein insertion efficiency factor